MDYYAGTAPAVSHKGGFAGDKEGGEADGAMVARAIEVPWDPNRDHLQTARASNDTLHAG